MEEKQIKLLISIVLEFFSMKLFIKNQHIQLLLLLNFVELFVNKEKGYIYNNFFLKKKIETLFFVDPLFV